MNPDNQQRFVVNKTYDEIHVGDFASLTRTLMPEDVKLFAVLTGDFNPTAADARYSNLRRPQPSIAYLSLRENPSGGSITYYARTASSAPGR